MGNKSNRKNLDVEKQTFEKLTLEIIEAILKSSSENLRSTIIEALERIKTNIQVTKAAFFLYQEEMTSYKGLPMQKIEYITPEILKKFDGMDAPVFVENSKTIEIKSDLFHILNDKQAMAISFIPLRHEQRCLGYIVFEDSVLDRKWNKTEIGLLSLFALLIVKSLKIVENPPTHLEKRKTNDVRIEENNYQTRLHGYALVVDDNRLNRIAIQKALKNEGILSKLVTSGQEAIDAIQNEKFDIVLMDIHMPEMDGIEATRKIRLLSKTSKKMPIIGLSINPFLNDYDFLKTSGMDALLLKPIEAKSLYQVLHKYISNFVPINIPEELFVFDKNDFEQRFEGSSDIANEVIVSFLDGYESDYREIIEFVDKKEIDSVREKAHYCIGTYAYLSGKRVVWLLNSLIKYAKKEQYNLMDLCVGIIEEELGKFANAIKEYKRKGNSFLMNNKNDI